MKKLISAMSLLIGLGLANAQQTRPVNQQTKVVKVERHQKTVPAKNEQTVTKTTTTVKMKKDGTPDKRYKANQHLKKDGTPDKRYKTSK